MSIKDCINQLVADAEKRRQSQEGSEVKPSYIARVDKVQQELDDEATRLTNIYKREKGMAPEAARAQAEIDAVKFYQQDKRFKSYSLAKHKLKEEEFLLGLKTETELKDATVNIGSRIKGETSVAFRKLAEFIETYRSQIPGGLDAFYGTRPSMIKNLVRAMRGETSDPISAKFAAELQGTVKELVGKLRQEGVEAHYLDGWGMTVSADRYRLLKMGESKYTSEMMDRIDRNKMTYGDGTLMSEEDLLDLVKASYLDQATNQSSKLLRTGKFASGRSSNGLISRHSYSRIFHLETADDMMQMHSMLGKGDIYQNYVNNVESMSRDLAIARTLGNRPGQTIEKALAKVEVTAASEGRVMSDIYKGMFDQVIGKGFEIESMKVASAAAGIRNLNTAIRLDKILLSSATDIAYVRQQAQYLGMSSAKVFGKSLSHVLSLGKKERRIKATQMLYSIEYATNSLSGASRWVEIENFGKFSGATQMMADFTLRANGSNAWVRNMGSSFHLELQGHIGSFVGKTYDQLPKEMKRMFKSSELSPSDWKIINKTGTKTEDGVPYIDIDKLDSIDSALAGKYAGMIQEQTDMALNKPNVYQRAKLYGTGARGNIGNELRRSFTQFWAFPVTTLMNQYTKFTSLEGNLTKAKFIADIVITTQLLSMMGAQLKEIASGNEPFEWDSPELFVRGLSQSVVGAPLAESMINSIVRGDSAATITSKLGGPSVGLAAIWIEAAGKIVGDVTGKNKKAETPEVLLDTLDQVNNVMYLKPVTDFLMDRLRDRYDPKYKDKKKRLNKRLKDQNRGRIFNDR